MRAKAIGLVLAGLGAWGWCAEPGAGGRRIGELAAIEALMQEGKSLDALGRLEDWLNRLAPQERMTAWRHPAQAFDRVLRAWRVGRFAVFAEPRGMELKAVDAATGQPRTLKAPAGEVWVSALPDGR